MNCPEPGCTVIGYCRFHAKLNPVVKEKKVYVIPKESKKRIKEKRIYRKIVAEKTEQSQGLCVLKGPTCSIFAEGGDHIQNRTPSNYIDPNNIVPACNNCNTLKVQFPKIFEGYVKSKFAK